MRNRSRSRFALLVAGVAVLCLLGQAAAVSPAQAGGAAVLETRSGATLTLAGGQVLLAENAADGPSAGSPLPARSRAASLLMSEDFEDAWPSGLWATYDWDGAENGEYYWGSDDFKPHAGSKSAWPARGGANGLDPASNDYPVNLYSWMVYGPFDLSAYTAANFDFYHWNMLGGGGDVLFWGASANGTSYSGDAVSGDSAGWEYESIDLSSYLGDSDVWIGFFLLSDSAGTAAGPFVDDVGLWGEAVLPGAFGKLAPADEATEQSLAPTLSWEASSGAASYQYCYDTTDDAVCTGSWVSTGATTSAALTGLAGGTTYFWQVRANNTAGGTYADGGAWWQFTTTQPALLEESFLSWGIPDGWALERDEDSGKGGTIDASATAANVGDDGADRQFRSILYFDTSGLPDDAVVTGVTLRIKRQSITGTNPFTTHGYLIVDMKSGFYHDDAALEKLDFHAVGSRGNVGRFIKTPAEGWYRAPLRAPSYPLINLGGATQFRLRFAIDDNDDLGADYLSFFTGNAPAATDRPELVVTYYVP